ncbi:uncharacterized protein FOMMEDRAFT_160846 [Fomitiporia mediterranea MF3/22]|uniref:uncharacterized protein n=1 Tax=Fomitiporia mediterranea (strain MF3/22) TaxID=694068 RepID=UPI00044079C9|nr:uncharacterized protein FOMMEDRAFT_160846 [Fomitiporia mediterranea MF3/22]EJC99246.1 hypothetical protein FOMMEDRAFT_160846 [Fomitiporia mediterranea MF3/22]
MLYRSVTSNPTFPDLLCVVWNGMNLHRGFPVSRECCDSALVVNDNVLLEVLFICREINSRGDISIVLRLSITSQVLCLPDTSSHPDRSTSLVDLANTLYSRYQQHGRTEDLEDAIQLQQAALELHPEGHPNRSISLNNLAHCLSIRYEQRGRSEDLGNVIELQQAAFELYHEGHPNRSTSLNNLASSLSTRYEQRGKTEDLENAIELHRAALKLRPEGHPDHSVSLRKHCLYTLKSRNDGTWMSLKTCLLAARQWADLARSHDHGTSIKAYKEIISVIQYSLTVSPTLCEPYDFLTRRNVRGTWTLEAASCAIEKNELEHAIEILEQGRGLLWSQLHGFSAPLVQLAETNEELANKFRNVSRLLENLTTSHEGLRSNSAMGNSGLLGLTVKTGGESFDELLRMKRRFLREQEEIVNEIRRKPGFENFLQGTPFEVLQQTASEGPVIVVNHCKYRSDALIVLSRKDQPVVCAELDSKLYQDATKASQSNEFPNAGFAFLSACHSAELFHSGAYDEAHHLSAAMQFSGFRSVIGTMWELYDEDGPLFSRVVYEYMIECEGDEPMYKRASAGLRKAAIELRAQEGIPSERWVNFVHIGARMMPYWTVQYMSERETIQQSSSNASGCGWDRCSEIMHEDEAEAKKHKVDIIAIWTIEMKDPSVASVLEVLSNPTGRSEGRKGTSDKRR